MSTTSAIASIIDLASTITIKLIIIVIILITCINK